MFIKYQSDWFDINEEMPEDRRDVIIANNKTKCVSVGWFNHDHGDNGKWLIRTVHFDGEVTHWTYLPNPPIDITKESKML